MRRFLVALVVLCSALTLAQDRGFPRGDIFDVNEFDTVNRRSLNTNFHIPIMTLPGRGAGFSHGVHYNSRTYWKSNSWLPIKFATDGRTYTADWGWLVEEPFGKLHYREDIEVCIDPRTLQVVGMGKSYSAYDFIDANGTAHQFSLYFSVLDWGGGGTCAGSATRPRTGFATDESGYKLDATDPAAPKIIAPDGTIIEQNRVTDRNGNYVLRTVNGTTDTWTDASGRTALQVERNSTTTNLIYNGKQGTRTVTVTYQTFDVRTAFGCSGVSEYVESGVRLPTRIDFPDGTYYQFSYEPTPGSSTETTARLASVTLPTGGVVDYEYYGANGGMECSSGATARLRRTVTGDGSAHEWTYDVAASGSDWETTVTYPQLPYDNAPNQTEIKYTDNLPVEVKVYQGSAASGTLLQSTNTTFSDTNPTSTTIRLWNTDGTLGATRKLETTYDSYGNLTEERVYDWGATQTVPLQTKTYSFVGSQAYTSRNIRNLPSEASVYAGDPQTGTLVARTEWTYDGGSLVCLSGAAGHDDANYPCSMNVRGNATGITFHASDSGSHPTLEHTFGFDSLGNIRSHTLGTASPTTTLYAATDEYTYPTQTSRGTLTQTYSNHFSSGLLLSSTNPNSETTTYSYHATLDYLSSIERADGALSTITWNASSRERQTLRPVAGPPGNPTETLERWEKYDQLGRRVRVVDEDGSGKEFTRLRWDYDPLGRTYRTYMSSLLASTPHAELRRDALNRVVWTKAGNGNVSTTVYSGPSAIVTDADGNQRKYTRDGLGRVIEVLEQDPANGDSLTLSSTISYGAATLRSSRTITSGVQTRVYWHDGLGRVVKAHVPEATSLATEDYEFEYDGQGNLARVRDAREYNTIYSYDLLNRLTQIAPDPGQGGVPSSPQVRYYYGSDPVAHNAGRLLRREVGNDYEEVLGYDGLGRIATIDKRFGVAPQQDSYLLQLGYDLVGNTTSLTYPSGRVVATPRNGGGQVTSVTSGNETILSSLAFDIAGRLFKQTYAYPGITKTVVEDRTLAGDVFETNRVLHQVYDGTPGQTLFDVSYTYHFNGQLDTAVDAINASQSLDLGFDSLQRSDNAGSQGGWSYDRHGNRLTQSLTGLPLQSLSVSPTTNRITSAGFTYDRDGRLLSHGNNTFTYDVVGHLTGATTAAGTVGYGYDSEGHPIRRTVAGATDRRIFFDGLLLAEYGPGAAATAPSREHVFNPEGRHIATHDYGSPQGGSTTYRHHWGQYSLRFTTDSTGAILARQQHHPFGELTAASGNVNSPYTFGVALRDPTTGLDWSSSGWYASELARPLVPSTLDYDLHDPQTFSGYSTMRNDPFTTGGREWLAPSLPASYEAELHRLYPRGTSTRGRMCSVEKSASPGDHAPEHDPGHTTVFHRSDEPRGRKTRVGMGAIPWDRLDILLQILTLEAQLWNEMVIQRMYDAGEPVTLPTFKPLSLTEFTLLFFSYDRLAHNLVGSKKLGTDKWAPSWTGVKMKHQTAETPGGFIAPWKKGSWGWPKWDQYNFTTKKKSTKKGGGKKSSPLGSAS